MRNSTTNSRVIPASPEDVYDAFTQPKALENWLAPGEMTGRIQDFDLRVGGGYVLTLSYPDSDRSSKGKTTEKEDRSSIRFVELTPPNHIVEAITFQSDDEAFSGEMLMDVKLESEANGTKVTIAFSDIPPGIRPEDNEMGTEMSLDKLEKYLKRRVEG